MPYQKGMRSLFVLKFFILNLKVCFPVSSDQSDRMSE